MRSREREGRKREGKRKRSKAEKTHGHIELVIGKQRRHEAEEMLVRVVRRGERL
jgi:hypothetical protein